MNDKRKKLIFAVIIAMVATIGGVGLYYWYNNTHYVSTEDARVAGDLVKISPETTGELLEFTVEEGDTVFKDQIVGRLEMSGNSDGDIERSVIRAPIDGIVIKKAGNVGEIEAAGQILAMIVDPDRLYISANIEETKLGRVRQGQKVDITIDQFKGIKFTGKVKFVGQAANSAFSLLPLSTSGTFTKVVQRIPVKIELDRHDMKLLPGTNAVVRIHIN